MYYYAFLIMIFNLLLTQWWHESTCQRVLFKNIPAYWMRG